MTSIESLFDRLEPFKDQPIDRWHPEKWVDIDIRIDAQGAWFYQGSPITRERIAKLFSTVLRIEDGEYFLVTPAVKYRIQVDDVPFQIIELQKVGAQEVSELYLRSNMDDVVMIDLDHPVYRRQHNHRENPIPYVMVRNQLQARLSRSVFYELIDIAETQIDPHTNSEVMGIYSAGFFFPLGAVSE